MERKFTKNKIEKIKMKWIAFLLFILYFGKITHCRTLLAEERQDVAQQVKEEAKNKVPADAWIPGYLADGVSDLPATEEDWNTYCKSVMQNEDDQSRDLAWDDGMEDDTYLVVVNHCFPDTANGLSSEIAPENDPPANQSQLLIGRTIIELGSTSYTTSIQLNMTAHDEDIRALQDQLRDMQERYDALVAYISNACPNEQFKALLE